MRFRWRCSGSTSDHVLLGKEWSCGRDDTFVEISDNLAGSWRLLSTKKLLDLIDRVKQDTLAKNEKLS